MTQAVFAIPGDHTQRTGGYIYEAAVLNHLNQIGCATQLLSLPHGFPDPSPAEMDAAFAQLQAVSADQVLILDGFLVGSLAPDRVAKLRAPMIGMVHHPLGLETGLSPERAQFLQRNEQAVLQHVAHVVVPSPHTGEVLRAQFGVPGAKISVALPGFDRPGGQAQPQTPPLILSVGLLAPRKGHDVLLKALGRLTALDWTAEIIGKEVDPTHAATLHQLRADLGLTDRVALLGELGADALAARFRAASIFALATRYEGYGMVLSEAMLNDLPVISCDVGAVPDTVGDAGLLVAKDDDQGFADALTQVLTSPDIRARLIAAARVQAAALPTWHGTARVMAKAVQSARAG